MLPELTQQKLLEEIELFIEYGVVSSEQKNARGLVQRYENNPVALTLLREFYRELPEAREEAVIRIAYLVAHKGVSLLVVSTASHSYLAAVSEGKCHLLGEYGVERIPSELLAFFGFTDDASFQKACQPPEKLDELPDHAGQSVCPVCQVAVGEHHVLGCPVEICPWCDGQLNQCNCRFEKLEVNSLDSEEQIEQLSLLLKQKGRLPYAANHKPGYPGTSVGLDRKSK